jgi:hypothetical protein
MVSKGVADSRHQGHYTFLRGSILRYSRLRGILRITVALCLVGGFLNLRLLIEKSSAGNLSGKESLVDTFWLSNYEQVHNLSALLPEFSTNANSTLDDESKQAFSACLLVRDDNHWLIEWIAYHYHVLPLRHLILVKDPQSRTSPSEILSRWRDKMIIEEWTDTDFLPEWIPRKVTISNVSDLWLHLNRQNCFYAKCLQSLHKRGRGWVTLTDSDEFIRVNPFRYRLSEAIRKQSGHVLHFLRQHSLRTSNVTCLNMPRIQVTAVEKAASRFRLQGSPVPQPFNASDFLTFRFLYHNKREMMEGKNIINLRNLGFRELPKKRTISVHRTLPSCPDNSAERLHDQDSYLQIQHYLGTFEQFSYRDDPRDSLHARRDEWYTRGQSPEPTTRDTGIEAWISGFVEVHGMDQAMALLKDVGKLESRNGENPQVTSRPPPANFSACLVVKDDNHWLIEWLAYHYHVLPLRELIVIVDPSSKTSPREIFARWRDRMVIEEWADETIMPSHMLKKAARGAITASQLHRQRQQFFYGQCLRALHQRNATWVLLSDTDEFVVPSTLEDRSHHKANSLIKSGAIRRILNQKTKRSKVKDHTFAPPCHLLPRLQITSQDTLDIVAQDLPWGFVGRDFLTTRWLFHNGKEIHTGKDLDGKNIINLEHLRLDELPPKIKNVHHILPDCPTSDGQRLNNSDSWLWMYQYVGSLEQFTFRDDPRDNITGRPVRNESLWRRAGRHPHEATYQEDAFALRAWLSGFVQSVGWFEARRLLQDVGRTTPSSIWRWHGLLA